MNTIETPITYRLEFYQYGGRILHNHTYYSLPCAIRWYEYFKNKLKGRYTPCLFAYRGDTELMLVNVESLYKN